MVLLFFLVTVILQGFDHKQYMGGKTHWKQVTKPKYRDLMRFQNGAVKGMHVPVEIRETSPDNPYIVRTKSHFYSRDNIVDPRQDPAYHAWKLRKSMIGYTEGQRYGKPRPKYYIYRDNGYVVMTRFPVSLENHEEVDK